MNSSQISVVGIVGTGLMGSGIAAVFAAAGRTVLLFDHDPKRLEEAKQKITEIGDEMRRAGLTSLSQSEILSQIKPLSNLSDLRPAEFIL
ncbi:MAG TPA: 3-hydroxyacyl-CoA dehydrogenase NAD-binding domain-containing protein, partial [Chthoniobacterales bacterium]|nr:3-hydroxyacyl-CoA dehydrogenase NAD-binding domain-containing protein [Chthoniobacterales bacterium]